MKLLIFSVSRIVNYSSRCLSRRLFLLLSGMVLAVCRGSDGTDISNPQFTVTNDPGVFGFFLNTLPGVQKGGAEVGEIDNVPDFPDACYKIIELDNTRDRFYQWRKANGFINANGTELASVPRTSAMAASCSCA